ncbi:MAG: aldose epimerase [Scytonema sp. PMC 1069.18]|nr:aldose epimerase [Scytonema sp. PMC 1069.18]MEC4879835.1 aldose epimerase [Scytonema sp. PMC 1070.18]
MCAIAVEQQQYKTYILSDESTRSQVSIVPERGGIITTWQLEGQDIFYMDTERFANPTLSVRGGIPLLFPICGNLVDDTYTLNGKTYQLKQHGFARNLAWEVSEQSDSNGASLTVSLKSSEETRAVYPFDFELNFIYTLRGNNLELRYRHTNLSQEPMPFATGIHPYFYAPDKSKLVIDLPSNQYQVKGDKTVQTLAGEFDFEQDEIDFAFINLSKQSAVVTDQSRNLKLTVSYDENYSTLVFWTVKGKDFYCLEPWSAPRNSLNTGESLLQAEPNATVETVINMTVESV